MDLLVVGLIIALVLAAVDEVQAQGRSLLGWAVIVLAAALLWSKLG